MFGNLVQIELIRLFRNKALKISGIVGAIMLFFFAVVEDYLISLGALDAEVLNDITPYTFKAILFISSFSLILSLVVPVNVVYTTCDYQRSRLAVNIEGAIRSRFKLCMSEVTGIFLFIAILDLLVFPGLFLIYITEPVTIVSIWHNDGYNLLETYEVLTLAVLYTSLVVYLISKFTSKAFYAIALSITVSILGMAGVIFMTVLVSKAGESGIVLSSNAVDIIMYMLLAVPILVLSLALAVRYRRADRIS